MNDIVGGSIDLTLGEEQQKAAFESHMHQCLSAESVSFQDAQLISSYIEWGWATQLTVTTGDCGVHVMAIHKHLPVNAISFRKERMSISDAQKDLAGEQWYQDAFQCAQEYEPPDPAGGSSSSSSASVVIVDDCLADVLPPLPPLPPPVEDLPPQLGEPVLDLTPGLCDSSDSESESSVEDQPEKEDGPIEPSDAVVVAWALESSAAGKQTLKSWHGDTGKDSFGASDEDVKQIVALEELIQLRKAYLLQKSTGKKPPRQRAFTERGRGLLTARLALGKDYLDWLAIQPDSVKKHKLATYPYSLVVRT